MRENLLGSVAPAGLSLIGAAFAAGEATDNPACDFASVYSMMAAGHAVNETPAPDQLPFGE